MANPQRENGHIDIANEIAEVLARINLRPYEWRTLWALWRKTYGWHKKEDKISLSQFQKVTGLERRNQCKALKTLMDKNIITCNKRSYIVSYKFQKDYTLWKVVSKQTLALIRGSVCSNTTPVFKQTLKVVSKQTPTKENKETIQKKNSFSNLKHPLIFKTQVFQYLNNAGFIEAFNDYLEMRIKIHKPATNKAQELVLKDLHKYNLETAIKMLENSIVNSWRGVFPLREQVSNLTKAQKSNLQGLAKTIKEIKDDKRGIPTGICGPNSSFSRPTI